MFFITILPDGILYWVENLLKSWVEKSIESQVNK